MGKDWFKNNIQSVIFLLNSIFPNEMGLPALAREIFAHSECRVFLP